MHTQLKKQTLLDSEHKNQQMHGLVFLKLITSWLEKQEWVTNPYGGQNPVQDLIFQAHLTANRMWEDFFSNKEKNSFRFDLDSLRLQIQEICELTPELKQFVNSKSYSKLENNLWTDFEQA